MTRVKTGPTKTRRHKKVLSLAKGYMLGRSNLFRQAKNAVAKADLNAYRDRRLKKRSFRRLWITRISAFLNDKGIKYSRFINDLNNSGIFLNRKMLADLCAQHPQAMEAVIKEVSS